MYGFGSLKACQPGLFEPGGSMVLAGGPAPVSFPFFAHVGGVEPWGFWEGPQLFGTSSQPFQVPHFKVVPEIP